MDTGGVCSSGAALLDAAPGLPLWPCPPTLLAPVFTELQTTKRAATAGAARGAAHSAHGLRSQLRRTVLEGAIAAAEGGGASGSGGSLPGSEPGSPAPASRGTAAASPASPGPLSPLSASALGASLRMSAPAGDGGAVARPHAAMPTAHVALSLQPWAACPMLRDGSALPLQLEAKDGLEILPPAAMPQLLLLTSPEPGGLADMCGCASILEA
eukprot:363600-Chlamydomonas_euryale.AAC.1